MIMPGSGILTVTNRTCCRPSVADQGTSDSRASFTARTTRELAAPLPRCRRRSVAQGSDVERVETEENHGTDAVADPDVCGPRRSDVFQHEEAEASGRCHQADARIAGSRRSGDDDVRPAR